MSEKIRVRFAPSPTGHLHIGGARTALFNWLFARANNGAFILRIEDTDLDRSTDEYIQAIIEGMNWLGLTYDEGPHRQTARFDVYKRHIDRLLSEGKAYRCYCTKEELEAKKEAAIAAKIPYKYDGTCRNSEDVREGVSPVVRFRMPQHGATIVDDLIRGRMVFENEQLDDLVIARSDGSPVYNFVVVVDDVDMGITHVIRGDDHINNTPKQIQLYKAIGQGEPPLFAHLPMILGADKTRLSKRHGATSVMAYKDMGYLPEALNNYLVRLGWSSGDQEVFSMDEMVAQFDFSHIGKSAGVFNPEKLLWLNAHYIKNSPSERLAGLIRPFLAANGLLPEDAAVDSAWLAKAVNTLKERSQTLVEMAGQMRFYIGNTVEFDQKSKEKFLTPDALPLLESLRDRLHDLADFSHDGIESVFKGICENAGIGLKKIAQPARVALTGATASPGIYELVEVMGKDLAVARLNAAIEAMKAG